MTDLEFVQKKKYTQIKREKMSSALFVSDVDNCGETLPLKDLRKVTELYVFSVLLLLLMANMNIYINLV